MERRANGGRNRRARRFGFAETRPLSTYLFAFGAGRFRVETAERAGRTFRMLHRETDAAKVERNRDTIFDLHASSLAWLERYTGMPYPWGKFDFLLVPSFQFGGMEHAGSIFYNASALFLDPSATQNQKLGRASLIAHETAHMWFGDLVTMRWFDDVWMKEVFANFMAAKIVNPAFPEINHDLRFLFAHYPAAYDIDRTPGTNAIRQRLDNLNEAGSLYGAIIYQKAPIVMRQLESILGADPFRDGLREYLKQYEFGNATWPDLIAMLDRRTDEDLAAWSNAWVQEAGRPIVTTELKIENGRIARLAFVQKDPAAARGLVWNQRFDVAVGLPEGVRRFEARLAGGEVEIAGARGLPAPDYVLPNGGGIAYGGFVLDPGTIKYLLRSIDDIRDPVDRGAAWVALWEQMLDRRARPDELINVAIRTLPAEPDEQIVQRVLNYTQQTYWRFLKPGERDVHSPALEQVLRAGLDAAKSSSLKSAWFSALRDVARSESVVRWLESVWRGERQSAWTDARRARLHFARAGACGAGSPPVEGDPRRAAAPHGESRSQGALRVRAARAVAGSADERCVFRKPEGREESQAGTVGARGAHLPPSPAAGVSVREVHPGQPRAAARGSADRRHLLPEAMDGRDAQRPQFRDRRVHGATLSTDSAC